MSLYLRLSGLQSGYLQIPDLYIRPGKDHLLSHRMGQSHSAREHGRKEDVILGNSMNQVLGVGCLAGSFHLLVDPKVGAEFESRLDHQSLLSQVPVDGKLLVEVALDLA